MGGILPSFPSSQLGRNFVTRPSMSSKYVGPFGGTAAWRGTPYGAPSLEREGPRNQSECEIRVRVRFGDRHNSWEGELSVTPSTTVGELKARLADIHALVPSCQVLRRAGLSRDASDELKAPLEDDSATLSSLDIGDGGKLQLSAASVLLDGSATEVDREAFHRVADAKADVATHASPVGLWANHSVGAGTSPANLWAQHDASLRPPK